GSELVAQALLAVAANREVLDRRAAGCNGFRRPEFTERSFLAVESGDNAAVQRGIEFHADVLSLDARDGGCRTHQSRRNQNPKKAKQPQTPRKAVHKGPQSV